jgi:hypothetical protein
MFQSIGLSIYASVVVLLLAQAASTKAYPPLDVITGLDSYVEKPSIELVRDAGTWNDAWQRHKGITPIGNSPNASFPSIEKPPIVDFTKDEVLVIFGGLASQGGYKVVDSELTNKHLVIRIRALPLFGNGGSLPNYKANPYAFVLLKQPNEPIELQIERVSDEGVPTWATIANLGK